MKKGTIVIIAIIAVIVGSIAYHKISTKIAGIQMAKMMSAPTRVETTTIQKVNIHDSIDYVGRIESPNEVKVVSRVSGWLEKMYFKEGDFVKKGQPLLLIEQNEYILAVKNAEADLKRIQASYNNSLVELNRAKELVKGDYVSRSYYDNALAKYEADKASVDAAKAALDRAKLNLGYTTIRAPFDGKMGKLAIATGNYITAQSGDLVTLVTMDPIYANFTVKRSDLARFKSDTTTKVPNVDVKLTLADGTEYNEAGVLDFIDNSIDRDLGTILLRATFQNKNNKLIPNDFVRVNMTSKEETEVTLIPQSAVLENVNSKYVWIMDEKGCAQQRDIDVVGAYKDNWIVKSGIKEGDVVISSNLQSMRQGARVQVMELSAEDKAKRDAAWEEAIHSNMTQKPNQKNKKDEAE